MRLATVSQSQLIDQISQRDYALSAEILMESAGALAAREVTQSFFPEMSRGSIAVVCGPGNNGGDGMVLARHLHSSGYRDLVVFVVAPPGKGSDLFLRQKKRVELQGIRMVDVFSHPDKLASIRSSSLVIDAIFGIGLTRAIEGVFAEVVDEINSLKVPVVSLDVPSGLNANTGNPDSSVVKAKMTLSFGLAKPGFFVADGPHYVGQLRVLPIGFPHEVLRETAGTHFAFNEKLAKRYLPKRRDKSNKSDFGHLLVLAGSRGMWGAGLLASVSAYRLGCGYVTWMNESPSLEQIREAPEILTANIDDAAAWQKKFTAAVIGPGFGVNDKTHQLIKKLMTMKIPVVVDADAITICAKENIFPLPKNWLLTPHTGELARLMNWAVLEIEKDRYQAVLSAAQKMDCHVLLKGFRSIVSFESRCMVVTAGNSALAKAGTGDVLAGMIGSLLAQGLDTLQATATATYIHGRLADEWVRMGYDKRSLNASDLSQQLPELVGRISAGVFV